MCNVTLPLCTPKTRTCENNIHSHHQLRQLRSTYGTGFPPFLELVHFTLGLNRGHELTGFYHLTWSMVAVIYNGNFQHGWGG